MGEKSRRETLIGCLYHVSQARTKPVTQACALTKNWTGDLLLCGMMPNPLSHTGQGSTFFLILAVAQYHSTALYPSRLARSLICRPLSKCCALWNEGHWGSHRRPADETKGTRNSKLTAVVLLRVSLCRLQLHLTFTVQIPWRNHPRVPATNEPLWRSSSPSYHFCWSKGREEGAFLLLHLGGLQTHTHTHTQHLQEWRRINIIPSC